MVEFGGWLLRSSGMSYHEGSECVEVRKNLVDELKPLMELLSFRFTRVNPCLV